MADNNYSNPKDIMEALQVQMLTTRISNDPSAYIDGAMSNPEQLRKDMKLLAGSADNPLVQNALDESFVKSAGQVADLIPEDMPGAEQGKDAIKQMPQEVSDFIRDERFKDAIEKAAPVLDDVMKNETVQEVLKASSEPVSKATDMMGQTTDTVKEALEQFKPQDLAEDALKDLNGAIGDLKTMMKDTMPEMLDQTITDLGNNLNADSIASAAKTMGAALENALGGGSKGRG